MPRKKSCRHKITNTNAHDTQKNASATVHLRQLHMTEPMSDGRILTIWSATVFLEAPSSQLNVSCNQKVWTHIAKRSFEEPEEAALSECEEFATSADMPIVPTISSSSTQTDTLQPGFCVTKQTNLQVYRDCLFSDEDMEACMMNMPLPPAEELPEE